MDYSNSARRRRMIAVAGVVVFSGLAGMGVFLAIVGLDRADKLASVISLFVAILGLLASVLALRHAQRGVDERAATAEPKFQIINEGQAHSWIIGDNAVVKEKRFTVVNPDPARGWISYWRQNSPWRRR